MASSSGGRLFWLLGGLVMLLMFVGAATFFSVVLSVWLRLFAGRPLNGAGVAIRLGVAVGALGLVAGLMGWRSHL